MSVSKARTLTHAERVTLTCWLHDRREELVGKSFLDVVKLVQSAFPDVTAADSALRNLLRDLDVTLIGAHAKRKAPNLSVERDAWLADTLLVLCEWFIHEWDDSDSDSKLTELLKARIDMLTAIKDRKYTTRRNEG